MKNIMALLFVFLSALGYAQTKTYTATRVDSPPHIDGYLNDDCWLQVEWAGDFVQYEPQSGAAPSQQTQLL